jgi:aminopeptidase N
VSRTLTVAVVAVVAIAAATTFLVIRHESTGPPPEGIPLALAHERAARVSALRYDVRFRIPDRVTDPVAGRLTASFALSDASGPLAFDFAQSPDHLTSVTVNRRGVTVAAANGHVVVPRGSLVKGQNVVEFTFLAGNEALNRRDDFMYTLFVPARASLAMPCFDQPDLKARWMLSLDIPPTWTAVSNGAEVARTKGADRTQLAFGETQPLPTYLFAFAAGRFDVETRQQAGRTFRMFHRETDAAKLSRNRDAIFDLHARALAWLEAYTGIPYAFGKFDIVLIPAFQFSGMEHAGAVYYNAATLLLDQSATENQLLARANTISHETSHMWFGDLVTMKWFDDVWLKEVFANFMAAKIVNPSFPRVNHELRFLFQNYPLAYDVDRTTGANPIRQDLTNLNEAGSLYGAIIYNKAPVVMRQLELLIGADSFRDGLRDYLMRYALGNATWNDLIGILGAKTTADLVTWSHAWVDEPGRPTIRTNLQVVDGRIEQLALHEEDPRGRTLVWPQDFRLVLGGPDRSPARSAASPPGNDIGVTIRQADTLVADAAGARPPRWVLPIGGYGFFDLDPATVDYLSTSLADVSDPYARGTALVALWECMLEGKIPPSKIADDLLTALPRESDELVAQQMLDCVRALFWRFTPADDRKTLAPRLEAVLRAGLTRASSTSLKSAWFGAFRSTVTTPDGVVWLERVWRHDVTIDGLPLAETDEADIAADLAIRDVPDAALVLQGQLSRFKNADRRARFEFILPALSHDVGARDAFFESLRDVRNRQHEPWVLDAVRYLHHPLRAASSKKYIRPALDLVRDIQQTGDIFFPKRWADATLSGYQSIPTAAEVRGFIEHLPRDYPPRLRWVLLSAADPLFRAAKLLNQ